MHPKPPPDTRTQPELFRSRLENMLNRRHPLYPLSYKIDWGFFEREFGPLYVEKVGRPGLPIRLLVGLHFLKHAFGDSDKSVVERFVENPYWQYFCGFEYFSTRFRWTLPLLCGGASGSSRKGWRSCLRRRSPRRSGEIFCERPTWRE